MAEPALPVYATTAPSTVGVAAVGVAAVGVSMDGSSYMHVGGPTCKMTSMVVHGSHLFDHERSAMHNLQSYTHSHRHKTMFIVTFTRNGLPEVRESTPQ